MEHFEELIRRYAIKSVDEIVPAPIKEILAQFSYSPLSSGTFFRVFKVENEPWVMKEGKWDVHLQLHDKIKLPMPPAVTDGVLKRFSSQILPTLDEVKRQYETYLKFVEYFGFFSTKDDIFLVHTEDCLDAQRRIRASLLPLLPAIEEFYKIDISRKIEPILRSDVRTYNFLPKEYTIYGPSISPENKENDTVYIFQQFVAGTTLHDMRRRNMTQEQKIQLILIIYLILVMHYEIRLLPDTRPRYPVFELFDWLPKTDNIIISPEGVRFVDTRWFWETKANFVKRGMVIPELSLNATKHYLNRLLESL